MEREHGRAREHRRPWNGMDAADPVDDSGRAPSRILAPSTAFERAAQPVELARCSCFLASNEAR